jgi:hypothetical protein
MAQFIKVQKYTINTDSIAYIEAEIDVRGSYVLVHFIGTAEAPIRIDGEFGAALLKMLNTTVIEVKSQTGRVAKERLLQEQERSAYTHTATDDRF